ncbi:GTP cyclohydrolase I FolE [Candidatus Bathyarchaeota archaeon]|jgi:GTP cyclohydrolase IA|nr:GTP cyclohydrolase I FolE [Candidatus Bathyarchaeota archaeon]
MGMKEESVKDMLDRIDGGRGVINEEVMRNTPGRVCRMYNNELLSGYDTDPSSFLSTTFESDYKEMILVSGIDFSSLCEHHIIPFMGTIHIGYVPDGRILGLSKFVRLVDCMAHRLQLQERLASEIADTLMEHLSPLGVGVIINATHLCMSIRGVKRPGSKTITSALRGLMSNDAKAREEFIQLVKLEEAGS